MNEILRPRSFAAYTLKLSNNVLQLICFVGKLTLFFSFLIFLNRLARYIESMSRLQNENQRLQHSIRRVEEQKLTEVSSVKGDFQREIQALRALVDEEAKHKVTAQAEADNATKQRDRFANL